jgi:hypothetical protein
MRGGAMRGLAILIALASAPGLAHADPAAGAQPSDAKTYAVAAPTAGPGHISPGWGLYATMQGRSMDVSSRSWSDDPNVQPRDVEAGYGWRSGGTTALIGYDQHDYGPKAPRAIGRGRRDPNEPPQVQGSGVLGFSLVLHGR